MMMSERSRLSGEFENVVYYDSRQFWRVLFTRNILYFEYRHIPAARAPAHLNNGSDEPFESDR